MGSVVECSRAEVPDSGRAHHPDQSIGRTPVEPAQRLELGQAVDGVRLFGLRGRIFEDLPGAIDRARPGQCPAALEVEENPVGSLIQQRSEGREHLRSKSLDAPRIGDEYLEREIVRQTIEKFSSKIVEVRTGVGTRDGVPVAVEAQHVAFRRGQAEIPVGIVVAQGGMSEESVHVKGQGNVSAPTE